MVDKVETMTYECFPTHIVRSKCLSITPQDKKDMMDCTDWMIEQKMYTDNELTPKYQTHVMLFRDDAPAVWLKLREEFYQACRNYLARVDNFCQNQDCLEFTGSGAWVYKGWKSIDQHETNPCTIIILHFYLVYIISMFLVMELLEELSFMIQEQHQHMELVCKRSYQ